MRGLYAIVDADSLLRADLDVLRFSDAVLSASPAAMQLRDKRRDSRDHLRILRALSLRCRDVGVPLFGNDRVDLALMAGCEGVHLGQTDLSPRAARALAAEAGREDFLVGMSVHNARELSVAFAERPDYIALGPVFGTKSKDNPDPALGLAGLDALATAAKPYPRVAIGGIDIARAPDIARRCEMAAVIGALVSRHAPDPYAEAAERARQLHAVLSAGAPA